MSDERDPVRKRQDRLPVQIGGVLRLGLQELVDVRSQQALPLHTQQGGRREIGFEDRAVMSWLTNPTGAKSYKST